MLLLVELKNIKLYSGLILLSKKEANAWGTCLLLHAPLTGLSLKIYIRGT